MSPGAVRPRVIAVLIVLSAVVGPTGDRVAGAQAVPPAKPNLLFVLTDDQRFDTLAQMPAVKANFDVEFTSAIVSTPLCCPARATYLTGQYAHNLGVWSNAAYPQFRPREPDSLGPWLQAQGYYTGFMGKYLNGFTGSHAAPPGWDEFYGMLTDAAGNFVGNGYTQVTLRERFKKNGITQVDRLMSYPNANQQGFYFTRWLLEQARAFIGRAENPTFNPTGKPWALFVWPTAPHPPFIAEARHVNKVIPAWSRPPSFLEEDMSDKPEEVTGSIHRVDDPGLHEFRRGGMLRALLSVDDLVREVFAELDRRLLREETWGLYTSDNGFFWGEHHLTNKLYAYEEAARVPFRMAVPGIGAKQIASMVSSIDVSPTFAALAGDTAGHGFRGLSLLPLISGPAPSSWPKEQLIESRSTAEYDALRTPNYVYIEWRSTGHRELYWRPGDPYQLNNVAAQKPALCDYFSGRLAALKAA